MLFYKDTTAMVRTPDSDTDFVDVSVEVLQKDILAPFMFIIYLEYVLRTSKDLMKENSFTGKQMARSRRYPAETKSISVEYNNRKYIKYNEVQL